MDTSTINQPVSTQTANFSAIDQIRISADLNNDLRLRGASSLRECSLPAVLKTVKSAMSDPALSDIDFNVRSAEEIIFGIATVGTSMQRRALCKHLDPESVFAFPTLHETTQNSRSAKIAMDLIVNSIQATARHFGVNFNGDAESVAYTILTDYGGYTAVDLMLFFERVKSGLYKQDFQHVAARGINYDFLKSWLTEYDSERDLAQKDAYEKFGKPSAPLHSSVAKSIVEQMADDRKAKDAMRRQRSDLETQADALRHAWESKIFKNQVIRQWMKEIDVDVETVDSQSGEIRTVKKRKQIMCDESDSEKSFFADHIIRVHQPGGVEKLMKRAIFEYVAFHNTELTLSMYNDLVSLIFKKYGDNPPLDAEMKTVLIDISRLRRNFPAFGIAYQTTKLQYPDASEMQLTATAKHHIEVTENMYYNEYLPVCIQRGYPPLHRKEMIWQHILMGYVNDGNPNPVTKLIFE